MNEDDQVNHLGFSNLSFFLLLSLPSIPNLQGLYFKQEHLIFLYDRELNFFVLTLEL